MTTYFVNTTLTALMLLAASIPVSGAPIQYHLTGKLKQCSIDPAAAAKGEFVPTEAFAVYSFSVDVSDCRWSIQYSPIKLPPLSEEFLRGGKQATNLTMTLASDGQEFCEVMSETNHPDVGHGARRGPGPVPFCVDQKSVVLWYTYASHCVLRENTSKVVVPMESMHADVEVFRVPGNWELLPGLPGLPRKVTTYGYFNRTSILELLPPPEMTTNVTLTVTSTTNVLGMTLPLSTVVNCAEVTRWNGQLRWRALGVYTIETEAVEPVARIGEYPPKLIGLYAVTDFRSGGTSNANSVTIRTSTGWPSDSEVNLKR